MAVDCGCLRRPFTSADRRHRSGRSRLVAGLAVALALVAAGCGLATDDAGVGDRGVAGSGPPVEVVRLSDGDSGWFLIDGTETEIRLLDYNAPERFEGDGGPLSCNGAAAEAALADLLDAADLIEVVGDETDRFGRRLVDLVVDGRSAVDTLVDGGWGLAIGDDRTGRERMRAAAEAGRGLWGDGCGRPAADGVQVGRVEPDPAGPDDEDLNGETVELVNRGSEPIDLTGWDIRDDSSSNRFDLAGVLAPGDRLTVHTGSGTDGGGRLYLDSPSPVWSNRGDTVLIIDPDGVVAAWAFL